MNLALVVVGGMVVAAGGWLCLSAFGETTPPLARTVAHLHRLPRRRPPDTGGWTAVGSTALGLFGGVWGDTTRRRLDLIGRTPEAHAGYLAMAALAGFLLPLTLAAAVTWASATVATWTVSLGAAIFCSAIGVLLVTVRRTTAGRVALPQDNSTRP